MNDDALCSVGVAGYNCRVAHPLRRRRDAAMVTLALAFVSVWSHV